jgi:hypothetical protein
VKTAAKSQREIAARKVAKFLGEWDAGEPADCADDVVDMVFDVLLEPDRQMIEAGRAEINQALPVGPGGVTATYQRTLVAVIWRAMLHRADR